MHMTFSWSLELPYYISVCCVLHLFPKPLSIDSGFRPRRTVVLASWDGEELSLLGSTHFAEAFRIELTRRAIAYVNADCPIKGHKEFNARTDPLLADALMFASRLVPVDSPADKLTLYDQWLAQEKPDASEPE